MLVALPLVLLMALFGAATATQSNRFELLDYNPVANPAAVVTAGAARFTVLTERIIRFEYDARRVWEDRASLAFLNRNLAVPKFSSTTQSGLLTIRTSNLALTYAVGSMFTASTLNVTATDGSFVYHYGDADTGNLLGTIRSLDELGGGHSR